MKKWNLNSWTKFPAKHLPVYLDKKELDLVLSKIKRYPPLVFAGESRSLKKSLAEVSEGKAFFSDLVSPAKTRGGYFFSLPKTISSSFLS